MRVAGETGALQRVLGDCDGRTPLGELTARHGRDAQELIATLLERGAVVDGQDAWRLLHRQSSVGSALGRPLDGAALAVLEQVAHVPEADLGDGVALAEEEASSAVVALARGRRSTRVADPPIAATYASLSALLAAAYGVPRSDGGPRSGTVPSAGALYPLIVHVLVRTAIGPLAPGLWWLDPAERRLHRLGDGPPAAAALFVPEPSCRALVAREQPIVFLSADLARPSRKYGARGYRYALLEAGAAVQAASLTATEQRLPLRTIGGIDDGAVHAFLRLPQSAVALVALLAGS